MASFPRCAWNFLPYVGKTEPVMASKMLLIEITAISVMLW
jgi:hypothetical protein